MKIWRMTRISRIVPKTANTHSEHVIVIAFPLKQWSHERTSAVVIPTLPVLLLRIHMLIHRASLRVS